MNPWIRHRDICLARNVVVGLRVKPDAEAIRNNESFLICLFNLYATLWIRASATKQGLLRYAHIAALMATPGYLKFVRFTPSCFNRHLLREHDSL